MSFDLKISALGASSSIVSSFISFTPSIHGSFLYLTPHLELGMKIHIPLITYSHFKEEDKMANFERRNPRSQILSLLSPLSVKFYYGLARVSII